VGIPDLNVGVPDLIVGVAKYGVLVEKCLILMKNGERRQICGNLLSRYWQKSSGGGQT